MSDSSSMGKAVGVAIVGTVVLAGAALVITSAKRKGPSKEQQAARADRTLAGAEAKRRREDRRDAKWEQKSRAHSLKNSKRELRLRKKAKRKGIDYNTLGG